MTQHDQSPQTRGPIPVPRLVARHVAGRLWQVRREGAGCGSGWGTALAALDYRAHAITTGYPPTFWVDADALRRLRVECERLGVRVESGDDTPLPSAWAAVTR